MGLWLRLCLLLGYVWVWGRDIWSLLSILIYLRLLIIYVICIGTILRNLLIWCSILINMDILHIILAILNKSLVFSSLHLIKLTRTVKIIVTSILAILLPITTWLRYLLLLLLIWLLRLLRLWLCIKIM